MSKVKTFGQALKIFEAHRELSALDDEVNKFVADNGVRIISVSDTTVNGPDGITQGVIRVVAYE
jgi:hypothetical protein